MSVDWKRLDWKLIVPMVSGAVFGFVLAACTLGVGTTPDSGPGAAPVPAAAVPADLTSAEEKRIDIFRRVSPSVVNISSKAIRYRLFSSNPLEVPQGSGTGFVWDTAGHIVTNFHVIQHADIAEVTLYDDSSYNARLVGYHEDKDIAVLKIDAPASKLRPIEPGRSDDLVVGQDVLAIGNPFGFDHSLSTGVVSALGREILSPNRKIIIDVIQTDAAINPGNSGGPLLDSSGRLVGVNTAILSPSQANAGIGFAVPINIVKRIVPQLIEHGRVVEKLYPVMGIEAVPDVIAQRAGIRGVVVKHVEPGGGAAESDLRALRELPDGNIEFDVIVAVDGHKIQRLDDLVYVLEKHKPGDTVDVEYYRDGARKMSTSVRLSAPKRP